MKNKILVFGGTILLFVLIFLGARNFYQEEQKEQLSFLASEFSEIFVRDYSPTYGNKDAKVILTEFLDPECESCRRFFPIVKTLMNEFEGKVLLVVRYAPFHKNSKIAIRALEAARMQGKYWESMELLFEKLPEWGNHSNPRPELIFTYLPTLGLDMERLKKDMESESIEKMIKQDMEDLSILEVRGTPTFYVNGNPLNQFSVDGLRYLLRTQIEKAYGTN